MRDSRAGADRRGIQKIQSRLCAESREPNVGIKLTNREIMTWAEGRFYKEIKILYFLKKYSWLYMQLIQSFIWNECDFYGEKNQITAETDFICSLLDYFALSWLPWFLEFNLIWSITLRKEHGVTCYRFFPIFGKHCPMSLVIKNDSFFSYFACIRLSPTEEHRIRKENIL